MIDSNFSDLTLLIGPIVAISLLAVMLYLSFSSHFNSLSESNTLVHRGASINDHYYLQLIIFIIGCLTVMVGSLVSVLTLVK